MSTNIAVNAEQRLFVIPSGEGYTCFGFDNAFAHAKQLSNILNRPDLSPRAEDIGKVEQYQLYQNLVSLIGSQNIGTYFDPDTDPEVKRIIENYRGSNNPIRVFLGNIETGKVWLEENNVYGTIGRSMGPLKVPLLINRSDEWCGSPLLTACIVRLVDGKTKQELYRLPDYQEPVFQIVPSDLDDYESAVMANGALHARFKTLKRAQNWVGFMKGERMSF